MPAYNDRDPRRNYGDRPIRSSSSVGSPRPGISRSGSAPRSGSARPANRPQSQRPAGGSRPPQGRRPAPRRRRRGVQPRFFIFAAILVVVIVALVLIFSGGKDNRAVQPKATPTVAPEGNNMSNVTVSSATPEPGEATDEEQLGQDIAQSAASMEEEDKDNTPQISSADQVQVADLSINTSLPSGWMNVLLLGTDERTLSEPARTDTMIIASINTKTGEVKLTSLLRDSAVRLDNIGKYNGTYRLNAANYFGGPQLAMKTINECLDMNIQYYVSVNFYGFTRIAEALGGIDVDLTEGEMNEINKKQAYQYVMAERAGIDESYIANDAYLETYGANTHLNGRQTLAYARVRYVDNDITRAERQRTVIIKLTQKLRGRSAAEILALLTSLSGNVTTNMDLNTIGELAMTVLSSGIPKMESLLLPRNGTYTLDRRNDQEMLYDIDWSKNKLQLYNFIYE